MRTNIFILLLLVCSAVEAQVVRIQNHFNRCENGQCKQYVGEATGIVFHRYNGFSYVATAGHTFGKKDQAVSVHGMPAKLLAWKFADGDDFAVLRCRQISTAKLFGLAKTDSQLGATVSLHGLGAGDKFGRGDYSLKPAKLIESDVVNTFSRQGDSGGPLIDSNRKICGLISRTTDTTTRFIPVSRLRAWLSRCDCVPGWRGDAPPPPDEEVIDIPDVEKTDRIQELERQLALMRIQIEAIQNRPERPQSKPVDLSVINERLRGLENISIPIRIETTAGKIIRKKTLTLERAEGKWVFKPIVLKFDESLFQISN